MITLRPRFSAVDCGAGAVIVAAEAAVAAKRRETRNFMAKVYHLKDLLACQVECGITFAMCHCRGRPWEKVGFPENR